MDYRKASVQQLLIILSEDCPAHYKFGAAAELQRRKEMKINRYQHKAAFTGKSYRVTI